MSLILIQFLTTVLLIGRQTEAKAQDGSYSAPNQIYYTPYGPSAQMPAQQAFQQQYGQYGDPYADPYGGQQMYDPYGQQAPCGRSGLVVPSPLEQELNNKIGKETGVPVEPAVAEAPCDKPGAEHMPLEMMCSQPPDKGTGDDDVFRYYYNPIVQQCIPFSYSGKGGNANRFVSVKNCYEICHPADPTVKKPRVVSGIKAYLVPNLKADCNKNSDNSGSFDRQKVRQQPREVVIRQIPHPLDRTKTLTIIQNAQYVPKEKLMAPGFRPDIDPNVRRLYQYETVPQFIPYGQPSYGG